jgi:chemotaxis response regulator CheB
MPKAAIAAIAVGAVDEIVPIMDMAQRVLSRLSQSSERNIRV